MRDAFAHVRVREWMRYVVCRMPKSTVEKSSRYVRHALGASHGSSEVGKGDSDHGDEDEVKSKRDEQEESGPTNRKGSRGRGKNSRSDAKARARIFRAEPCHLMEYREGV